jgi:hypothetical protein
VPSRHQTRTARGDDTCVLRVIQRNTWRTRVILRVIQRNTTHQRLDFADICRFAVTKRSATKRSARSTKLFRPPRVCFAYLSEVPTFSLINASYINLAFRLFACVLTAPDLERTPLPRRPLYARGACCSGVRRACVARLCRPSRRGYGRYASSEPLQLSCRSSW